mgnify:CR=1 FL=1
MASSMVPPWANARPMPSDAPVTTAQPGEPGEATRGRDGEGRTSVVCMRTSKNVWTNGWGCVLTVSTLFLTLVDTVNTAPVQRPFSARSTTTGGPP